MDLTFESTATYQIRVKGLIPRGWSDRMGDMTITYINDGEPKATILSGQLADQAALLGLLNALYNMHLPLVSVEHLGSD